MEVKLSTVSGPDLAVSEFSCAEKWGTRLRAVGTDVLPLRSDKGTSKHDHATRILQIVFLSVSDVLRKIVWWGREMDLPQIKLGTQFKKEWETVSQGIHCLEKRLSMSFYSSA